MPMHKVEVDDEVFAFVKKHAEPLVDTFNSTLRRLLPLEASAESQNLQTTPARPNKAEDHLPCLPGGVPQALRQILEVAALVMAGVFTRTEATKHVAKLHGVAPSTVADKYGRQLNLKSYEFDRLLDPENNLRLLDLLRRKFPAHSAQIDAVFDGISGN
jgi:hypothetical protein